MIGVLAVSHGDLARVLLETTGEIVGPVPGATFLSVSRHESLSLIEERMRKEIHALDQGDGVLILADMFGGTAANVALGLVGTAQVEVVTGINLPMLLKLSSALPQAENLSALAQLLKFYGQRNVLVASELLKEREQDG